MLNYNYNQLQSLSTEFTGLYYPIDKLIDMQAKAPKCSLELAKTIFQNQNPDNLSQKIERCRDFLSRQFQPFKLSAFHLAVMSDNEAAMEILHAKKAKINLVDFHNYTPLHHAALKGNTAAVSKLLSWGANPDLINAHGGTYQDLLRLNAPFRKTTEQENNQDSGSFNAHPKEKYQIQEGCWQTNVNFVYENVARPYYLSKQWAIPARTTNAVYNIEKYKAYEEHTKDPVPLEIKKFDLPNGNSICGLFAQRDIKRGEMITEYAGEILPTKSNRKPTYLWEGDKQFHIDSMYYRSAGSMANHGFPNAVMEQLHLSTDGMLDRYILVALDDISKGEQIIINYGTHYEFENFHELRSSEIEQFLKENSWNEIATKLDQMLDNFIKTLNVETLRENNSILYKTLYILSQPSLIKELTEHGFITVNDLVDILEIADNPLLLEVKHKIMLSFIYSFSY